MNANNQKFWMLSREDDWLTSPDDKSIDFDCGVNRRLRLRSRLDSVMNGKIDEQKLQALLSQPSITADKFGTVAFWDETTRSVFAAGASGDATSSVKVCGPLTGVVVRDMTTGNDDVLYLSLSEDGSSGNNYIRMIDRRGRWASHPNAAAGAERSDVPLSDCRADRIAADPEGGVWVLDRLNKTIGRVTGYPLPDFLPGTFAPAVFRPNEENPDVPHFIIDKEFIDESNDEVFAAIACSPEGVLALISWDNKGQTLLRLRGKSGAWYSPQILKYACKPASVAWLSTDMIAVIPGPFEVSQPWDEAIVYQFEDKKRKGGVTAVPAGGYYPLINLGMRMFASGSNVPPRYPVKKGLTSALLPMSVAAFQETGEACSKQIDSRMEGIIWHRLFMEAVIPEGCWVVVSLAATDIPDEEPDKLEWNEHYFGTIDVEDINAVAAKGVWLKDRSEIPHHEGILGCKPETDRAGLFMVLIQRPGKKVRALSGQYLHVKVRLQGRGHITPEIAAIRVYGPRFSYRDNYLPELYHENLFGDDANSNGRATPSDFLQRYLDLFESFLTPLEDRVAAAQILMDPRSAPEEALEWLGSWLGIAFEQGFPQERRRAWLEAAPRLYQTRGTVAGLQLALEIATGGRLVRQFVEGRECEYPTGGAVSDGRVLLIEDFRLRRTFATILGADLTVKDDPLLPGALISSANSFVGDTLLLGDENNKEFLALFRHAFSDEKEVRQSEELAVYNLYDKLANRATILVHNEISPVDMGLLRKIVAQEAPAHIDVRVVNATWSLLVGLASLIEVDTYLLPRPPRGVARIGESRLGENAFVQRVPALDPRLTY